MQECVPGYAGRCAGLDRLPDCCSARPAGSVAEGLRLEADYGSYRHYCPVVPVASAVYEAEENSPQKKR